MPVKINHFSFFYSEPFRILFPCGILWGCIGVGHWLFYQLGWIVQISPQFHSFIQIYTFLMCFGAGFLMTALPKIMGVRGASPMEFWIAFSIVNAVGVFALLKNYELMHATFIAFVIFGFIFALKRMHSRILVLPPTFMFIPLAFIQAAIGSIVILLCDYSIISPFYYQVGKNMIVLNTFLLLIMGIAGFLAPRLMGHVSYFNKKIIWLHILVMAGFAMSVMFDFLGQYQLSHLFRVMLVTLELLMTTKMSHKPQVTYTYVYLLWGALWMIVLGLWLSWIIYAYRIAFLHVVFIGGFSLLVIVVASRVVFTHSGFASLIEARRSFLWFVASLILLALVTRVSADFMPDAYFLHLAAASSVWLIAILIWLIQISSKLLYIPERILREKEC